MSRPRNRLAIDLEQAKKEKQAMPQLSIGEWRQLENGCRDYARRYQVWGLLAWYHHDVLRHELGFRAAFRRLWWKITGQPHRLLSPWEALAVTDELARRDSEASPATSTSFEGVR